jgi:hypothetical protein
MRVFKYEYYSCLNMTAYWLINCYRRFGRAYCFHLHGVPKNSEKLPMYTVSSHKSVIVINKAMKFSSHIFVCFIFFALSSVLLKEWALKLKLRGHLYFEGYASLALCFVIRVFTALLTAPDLRWLFSKMHHTSNEVEFFILTNPDFIFPFPLSYYWLPWRCVVFVWCSKRVSRCWRSKANKAIPLQAWTGPLGFQEFEAPRFLDNRHMEVVMLSALRTGRL